MNDIKVSIIVPIYMVERFLPACVESLVNQTLKGIEIILVDDGSRDKCPELCDLYAKQYSNIKVIHKKNGGLSDARNAGLEIALGEWIGFVDSDDYVSETMFETLYNLNLSSGTLLSMCDFAWIDENNAALETGEEIEYLNGCCTEEDVYTKLNSVDAGHYVIAWNKLYHRSLFEELRFPVGKVNEDQYIMHEILYNASQIACTDEKLYKYRKVSGSIMNREYSVKRLDDIEGLHKRFMFYHGKELFSRLYQTERLAFNKFRMGLKKLKSDKESTGRVCELAARQKECYNISKQYHRYSIREKAERFILTKNPILYWNLISGR